MPLTAYIVLVLLGLVLGVLINGLADHLPYRMSSGWPACDYCERPYPPTHWLASFSYLTGRGRCPHCQAPIKLRAVAVELLSAGMLIYLAERLGPSSEFWLLGLLLQFFLLISVIDLEHRLILFVVVIPAAVAAALYGLLATDRGLERTLLGGAVGYALVFLLYLGGALFSRLMARVRGQALDEIAFGGGDVNLAGVIGLAVGWPGVIVALLLGVLAGGVGAVLVILIALLRQRFALFTAIPYGPFLVIGAVAILVWGPEIQAAYPLFHALTFGS